MLIIDLLLSSVCRLNSRPSPSCKNGKTEVFLKSLTKCVKHLRWTNTTRERESAWGEKREPLAIVVKSFRESDQLRRNSLRRQRCRVLRYARSSLTLFKTNTRYVYVCSGKLILFAKIEFAKNKSTFVRFSLACVSVSVGVCCVTLTSPWLRNAQSELSAIIVKQRNHRIVVWVVINRSLSCIGVCLLVFDHALSLSLCHLSP